MFTTPLRSENMPPIAPKTRGVAKPSVCAISVASNAAARFPVLERVARIPSPIPRMPAATAPQPSRRRPRVTVQTPSAAATMPTRIGHVTVRASIGGIARNAANAPRKIPRNPVVAGSRRRALTGLSRRAAQVLTRRPPPSPRSSLPGVASASSASSRRTGSRGQRR